MQKVEGSNPFSRLPEPRSSSGVLCVPGPMVEVAGTKTGYQSAHELHRWAGEGFEANRRIVGSASNAREGKPAVGPLELPVAGGTVDQCSVDHALTLLIGVELARNTQSLHCE